MIFVIVNKIQPKTERNAAVLEDAKSGMLQVDIAKKYSVTPPVIGNILRKAGFKRDEYPDVILDLKARRYITRKA